MRVSFDVIDDADGDGLDGAEEVAAGTDPVDADSDDDGLPDGADGLADSDGDGVIDALDCDSDDDGLADGLEAGVWQAPPATDPAAGCFVPDEWPATTTDPDRADTDGGGLPDGLEDRDGDGRVDASETDPEVASDDFAACETQPPAEVAGMRVVRTGAGLRLSWTDQARDGCTTYTVLAGPQPASVLPEVTGLTRAEFLEATPAPGLRFFLVRAVSLLAGPGRLRP